jgi:hyaluronoglucosaminidase
VPRTFGVRGVVEGFYGTPWSHETRLEMLAFLGAHDMNAYVYAPKDDPRHRARWREPYDAAERARFAELLAHGAAAGVRVGFAISPGLDVDYADPRDREALVAKLASLRDDGAGWFLLLLDDIPMRDGLAPRQAALAAWLLDALGGATLTVCPTEYVGTRRSPYLSALGRELPSSVGVIWTGPTVCSPRVTAGDAAGWAAALGDRPLLLWDNYPVNDGAMAASLHLGPYEGRDPALAEVVAGVLCNPMPQARASKVALATAAAFLVSPDAYDPAAEWRAAVAEVGGERAPALGALARACAAGPLGDPADLALARAVTVLEGALEGPEWAGPLAAVADELRLARDLPGAFGPEGDPLAAELAPWAAAARREAEAGLAAAALVQQVRPVATVGPDGSGTAAAPAPEAAMHAAFGVLFAWAGARANDRVVFGPRFAVYPAVVQRADGSPAVDLSLAVREDANAVDRLCRVALRAYEQWRCAPDRPLTVVADGVERPVDPGGAFDARGADVVVRAAAGTTRVAPAAALPFRDARLA